MLRSRMRWVFVCLLLLPALGSAGEKKLKVVTLGDSITRGSRPGVGVHQTFASLLEKDLREAGIKVDVVNVGIGGERTDQALRRLAKIIALNPDVVTIMYGTNDSYVDRGKKASRITQDEYHGNLTKIVAQLKKAGIQPVLMTEPAWGKKARLNGAGEHPNDRLAKYMEACRQVAREAGVPLVDHYAHWSKQKIDVGTWTTDQCHPNAEGHRVLTNLITPVVQKTLTK